MKTTRQYFFNALFSAVTVFVVGSIKGPSNCGQCGALLLVGSGLMFLFLLILGVPYFLMNIRLNETAPRILVGLLATLTPGILLALFLFKNYYDPEPYRNTDFEIASPAIVTTFFVGIWTLYLYVKNKPTEMTD